ncbi:bifunctional riboflavin kinase/FAD synthetase [Microbacterium sp. No. 7]|uniref:bifunctional riboflavin kinase/FAD synthetase n=1 Tax=Microbacterium sp. No. 7 TaxID=1714373 RepID=UPI0006D058F3|nr:bifunctional riboflavin kinase/FAD synthetase [Microbacterium sp. No. 7]ALJ21105.1 bifunctional riboflavin kinase/FMN adenylyltransferase [Microbacterium sp. No. 7]
MIVFRSPDEVPPGFGPSVVAIGKFDGVHFGHVAVIGRARAVAASSGVQVVAVTFDRNPLALLRPEDCPAPLASLEQKIRLLGEAGVDAVLVLRFDEALAALSPRDFVTHVLAGSLDAVHVVVGDDFRFGNRGAGTPDTLRELGAEFGFDVEVVGDVEGTGRRVSSTWVRELLSAGDVEGAARLLGRPHVVEGTIVHGLKRGRELGFPTANLSPDAAGFVPADGVYAGWLVDAGPGTTASARAVTTYPAAISVGTNPTFDDVEARQVEAYVLDETGLDLYGHRVQVLFSHRIRGMTAFDGIDALVAQMTDDVARVRNALDG